MKVINLFAGPGAGKSTTAAGLFYNLKRRGLKVELVTEYAKELVYQGHLNTLSDQVYVLAKQNKRLERLRDKVDYVITDSPLLLTSYYIKYSKSPQSLVKLTEDLFNSYDNINIFIERNKPYIKYGRLGDEKEAREADAGILKMLTEYKSLLDGDDIVDNAIDYIESKGNKL